MAVRSDIFDRTGALDRVAGDEALLAELIGVARRDVSTCMLGLGEAIQQGHIADVQCLAHRLRSALGNLGALKVYKALTDLERAAGRGELEACTVLIPSIATLIEEFFVVSAGS